MNIDSKGTSSIFTVSSPQTITLENYTKSKGIKEDYIGQDFLKHSIYPSERGILNSNSDTNKSIATAKVKERSSKNMKALSNYNLRSNDFGIANISKFLAKQVQSNEFNFSEPITPLNKPATPMNNKIMIKDNFDLFAIKQASPSPINKYYPRSSLFTDINKPEISNFEEYNDNNLIFNNFDSDRNNLTPLSNRVQNNLFNEFKFSNTMDNSPSVRKAKPIVKIRRYKQNDKTASLELEKTDGLNLNEKTIESI
jgi:hypothetical protein